MKGQRGVGPMELERIKGVRGEGQRRRDDNKNESLRFVLGGVRHWGQRGKSSRNTVFLSKCQ